MNSLPPTAPPPLRSSGNTTAAPARQVSPPNHPQSPRANRWLVWLIALPVALLIGVGLFVWAWQRDKSKQFYTVEPASPAPHSAVQVFEPLPAPAANPAQGSLLPAPPAMQDNDARIEEPPAPAPLPAPSLPAPPSSTALPPSPLPSAPAGGTQRQPIPISQPAPQYPRQALRDGIGGMVRVQLDVGPDGVPTSARILHSSGSRELDRAALDAARRWRFQPALLNGQPSVGQVIIPIQFTPPQ